MTHERSDTTGTQDESNSTATATPSRGVGRRRFLQAIGAGTLVGAFAVGSNRAAGIPTPWLHRDGNLIRDPDGNRVILRGVNIPDVKRVNADNYYSYSAAEYIDWATNGNSPPGTTDPNGWYSRVIRLPVQPVDIGGHDPGGAPPAPAFTQEQLDSYIENHLRPAVDHCRDRGVYCIVDYHRHRGQWDESLWFTSEAIDEEVRLFWNTVAPVFADDSHVLFEVYNEPTEPYPDDVDPAATNQAALDAWNTWKQAAQPWVDTIRTHAPDTLILIGSPRWSQWTAQAPRNEFDGSNLAYTGHVYGQEGLQPFADYFGTPAESVPVFLTEWGYKSGRAPYLDGTTAVEGQQFLELFENYPVHPIPWVFDFRWVPQFFDRESRDDWRVLRSNETHGGLVKDLLYTHRNDDLPGSGAAPTPTRTTSASDTPSSTPTDSSPTQTPTDGLLINDYDGDPAWSSNTNDLGQWCGAGSFQNGGGTVSDGTLVLEYDDGGWYQEQLNQSITDYSTLLMRVRGENGGEATSITVRLPGVHTTLSTITDRPITTNVTDVPIDLVAAGVDRTETESSVRLEFWNGGSSTVYIHSLWLTNDD